MKEAVFLCWDNTTVQGAFVLTEKDGEKYIMATSGPMPWPAKGPEEKWRVEADPDSATRVWLITKGKCGGMRPQKK
eukprot:7994327-Lingulodinium_polyedra.AAC.1